MSRGTQDTSRVESIVLYGALTRSGDAFQRLQVTVSPVVLVLQPRRPRRIDGLGLSRFARHYYGNLG